MEPPRSRRWSILLTFEKLRMRGAPRLISSLPCDCEFPANVAPLESGTRIALVQLDIGHAAFQSVKARRTGRLLSQPYAQDPRSNAGIAASSVARSKKGARLS